MKTKVENYYQHDYFEKYQKSIGEFGGKANLFKFKKYISKTDTVLDFGCGGGFLLKLLDCQNKIGVELNPVAREYCNKINQIECFETLDEIPDNSIDIIISNHCLEHTLSPYGFIEKMYQKLKPSGKVVLVVPLDSYNYRWVPDDINNHLYSFSPMNLGNLLQGCGFQDISAGLILHKWPPFYKMVYSIFGEYLFHQLCWIYGRLNTKWVQVKAIGIKEK